MDCAQGTDVSQDLGSITYCCKRLTGDSVATAQLASAGFQIYDPYKGIDPQYHHRVYTLTPVNPYTLWYH